MWSPSVVSGASSEMRCAWRHLHNICLTGRPFGVEPTWMCPRAEHAQLFGSMPMRSLTAFLRRCLQPRYLSVVWTETWPNRNWIWSNSPPASRHRRAQVRRRSCGARFSMAALLAHSLTTCHTTLSITPFPHVLPARQTHREIRPSLTPPDASQESIAVLTQSGMGTVRICRALPTKSTMAQWSSRRWRWATSSSAASFRRSPQPKRIPSSARSRCP